MSRLDHFDRAVKDEKGFSRQSVWTHGRNFEVGVSHLHLATEHIALAYLPTGSMSKTRATTIWECLNIPASLSELDLEA